jgi:hypothetical protein
MHLRDDTRWGDAFIFGFVLSQQPPFLWGVIAYGTLLLVALRSVQLIQVRFALASRSAALKPLPDDIGIVLFADSTEPAALQRVGRSAALAIVWNVVVMLYLTVIALVRGLCH